MDFTKLKKNLEKNGFTVSEFNNKEEAVAYLDSSIDQVSVGSGGSVTLKELNIRPLLEKHNDVYWHETPVPEGVDDNMITRTSTTVDVYLSSANAVSESGEIINVDGTGNRVAAMSFGHKKVYLIIGQNKVCENMEKAMWRVRNVAAPLNAKRLKRKTPCAVTGKCSDCDSPERICRIATILWRKPSKMEYEIVLVHEDLGF